MKNKMIDLNNHLFAQLPRLNGRFGRDYDSASPEVKPTILLVAKMEHQAREMKKGEKV